MLYKHSTLSLSVCVCKCHNINCYLFQKMFCLSVFLLLLLSPVHLAPTSDVIVVHPKITTISETAKRIEFDFFNGRKLQLSLSLNSFYISQSIVNITTTTTNSSGRCKYFAGNALSGGEKGWATISICSGTTLNGIIILSDQTYAINPLIGNTQTIETHVITKQKSPTKSTSGCFTSATPYPAATKLHTPYRIKRHEHHVIEKTIEIVVVADKTLLDLHLDKVTDYILDIVNIVSHLFKHPSTGAVINIALIDIIIWDHAQDGISTVSKPTELRDNFCEWKKKLSTPHDISVLLTRNAICETPDDCGILGITNYKSACDKSKSCIVIKDTGLSTAFTIAHEIGHSLGVYHDGIDNCKSEYHLMSPSFQESNSPHTWSECSKTQLNNFLSSSESHCLDNEPNSTDIFQLAESTPLIGTNYTLDEQCQLLFGSATASCYKTNCTMLWCNSSDTNTCTMTQYSPPADGSTCSLADNEEGVCYQGMCMKHDVVAQPVHGSWGKWGPWSQCSVTCGDGIQHSTRECNSPTPQFGGNICIGEKKRYKICNQSECPSDMVGYREEHCTSLKNKFVSGHHSGYSNNWTPVDNHELVRLHLNPCKLFCQEPQSDALYLIKDKLPDGLTCLTHHYTSGICINNKCIQIGCDGHLGTNYYTDVCGVHCGDNTTCLIVEESFTPTKPIGESEDIVTIPAGAKNIEFNNFPSSTNQLTATIDHYPFTVPIPTTVQYLQFSGTTWYCGIDSTNRYYLHSNGPTNGSVSIKVHIADKNPIEYKFTKPVLLTKWNVGKWSNCTKFCGNCTVTREVSCPQVCDNNNKPAATKTFAVGEPCSHFHWVTGDWSECKVQGCGAGTQTRAVTCRHDNSTTVDEKYCGSDTKPVDTRTCHVKCNVCTDTYPANICKLIVQQAQCKYSVFKKVCCKSCSNAGK